MTIPVVVPTFAVPGVPLNRPVAESKLAQTGLPETLNVSESPSASLAVGVNTYACPAVTVPAGAPLITGAVFGGALTWMLKGAREEKLTPSVTLIAMLP